MSTAPLRSAATALAVAALAVGSVLAMSAPASAATISVGPSGYSTISDAVAAAAPGQVITVAPGTYDENVTISTPVTLVGAGPASTTIVGTVTLGAPTDVSGFTIEAQATEPSTTAPYAPTTVAIAPGGAGSDLHGNVLANGYQDVYAQGVIGSAASPTLIEDNTIRDFHADQGSGIWIAGSTYVNIDGNTIIDGTPIDGNSVGVNLVCGSSKVEISANAISDVGNAVVDIANGSCGSSTAVSIEGNSISSTADSALYFGANNLADIAITRNRISNVGGTGAAIALSGSASWLAPHGLPINGFTVSGNSISHAPNGLVVGAGVVLGSASSVLSTHNRYCSSGRPLDNRTTTGVTIASVDDDFCSTTVGTGVVVTTGAVSRSRSTGSVLATASLTASAVIIDPSGALAFTGDSSTTTSPSAPSSRSRTGAVPRQLTLVEQREAAGIPPWLAILLAVLAAVLVTFVVFFVVRRRDA